MGFVLLRQVGNFRVVVRRGDGPEAGCLIAFSTVVGAFATNRWVLSDSCHRVGDSFGSRSRGRPIAVPDFFRGGACSRSHASSHNSGL